MSREMQKRAWDTTWDDFVDKRLSVFGNPGGFDVTR